MTVIRTLFQHQFVRYVIVGGASVSIEVGMFTLVQWLTSLYLVSNTVGFCAAALFGYVAQKYWTFRNTERDHARQGMLFALVLLWGYLFGSGLLLLFVEVLGWNIALAKAVQLVCVMISNYIGQSRLTFRQNSPDENQ